MPTVLLGWKFAHALMFKLDLSRGADQGPKGDMSSLFELNGRVVVVTGALGQLGRQYCAALLDHGARVAALDIAAESDDAVQGLGRLLGRDGFTYVCGDVTDRQSLEKALEAVNRRLETPFGLINNAALDSPPDAPLEETGPFETYPESSFDRVMEVNTKGVFLACQVFGNAMANRGIGSIVNIGSIYGLVSPVQDIYAYRRQQGGAFYKPVAYSVSKSALLNLTRYLATYWAKDGVRVNSLTLAGVFNHQDEQFLEGYLQRLPLGRMAQEDEYSGGVVFLMSDAARYMTGSNMVIDGGWTAW